MSGRALRADACRNRDRLLEVAAATFAERGVDASLEEIAKRSCVGIGTLYRHFPNRNALIEAVYRHEVETLCDSSAELLATRPPDEALSEWMRQFVRYVATKRGLAMALKSMISADSELFTSTRQRIGEALSLLVEAGVKAGTIRADTDPEDLLRALSGVCMATDAPGWQEQACRISGLLMDGLRYGAASEAKILTAG